MVLQCSWLGIADEHFVTLQLRVLSYLLDVRRLKLQLAGHLHKQCCAGAGVAGYIAQDSGVPGKLNKVAPCCLVTSKATLLDATPGMAHKSKPQVRMQPGFRRYRPLRSEERKQS